MSDWSTQRIGRYGERVAARFLRRAGFRIVAKNRHYGKNELDLIAQSKKYILFVEVKTRTFSQKPDAEQARPVMAVDEAKESARLRLRWHIFKSIPTKGRLALTSLRSILTVVQA